MHMSMRMIENANENVEKRESENWSVKPQARDYANERSERLRDRHWGKTEAINVRAE